MMDAEEYFWADNWTASVTWNTPYPLTLDMGYDIQATFYDTAGNMATAMLMITVEDNIKPEFTKI